MTFTLQFDEFSFRMWLDSAEHWFRSTDFHCRGHFTDVIFTICTIFQWWFLSGSHNILLINLVRSVITGKSQNKALMYIHQGRGLRLRCNDRTDEVNIKLFIIWSFHYQCRIQTLRWGGGGYLSSRPLDKRGGGPPGPLPGLNDRQP